MTTIRIDGYLEVDAITNDADRRKYLRHIEALLVLVGKSLSTDDNRREPLAACKKTVYRMIQEIDKRGKHAHCFFCGHREGYEGRELKDRYIPVTNEDGEEVRHFTADVCTFCISHNASVTQDVFDTVRINVPEDV